MSLFVLYGFFFYCHSLSFSRSSFFSFFFAFFRFQHVALLSFVHICNSVRHLPMVSSFAEPLNASTICIILSFYFLPFKAMEINVPQRTFNKGHPVTLFTVYNVHFVLYETDKILKNHTQLHRNNNGRAKKKTPTKIKERNKRTAWKQQHMILSNMRWK